MAFLLIVLAVLAQLGYGIFGERPNNYQKALIKANQDKYDGKITEKEYWDIWDKETTKFVNKWRL